MRINSFENCEQTQVWSQEIYLKAIKIFSLSFLFVYLKVFQFNSFGCRNSIKSALKVPLSRQNSKKILWLISFLFSCGLNDVTYRHSKESQSIFLDDSEIELFGFLIFTSKLNLRARESERKFHREWAQHPHLPKSSTTDFYHIFIHRFFHSTIFSLSSNVVQISWISLSCARVASEIKRFYFCSLLQKYWIFLFEIKNKWKQNN